MTDLLTPAAAAKISAISVTQLHDLAVAGEIHFVNIGLGYKRPTRRYLLADIEDFIARRRTTAVPPAPGKLSRSYVPGTSEVADFGKILDELRVARRKASADCPKKR